MTCKWMSADVEPNRPELFLLTRYAIRNWGHVDAKDGFVNGPIMLTIELSQITLTVDFHCDCFHIVL